MKWRWTLVVLLAMALAGCDTWFGDSPKAPLPGERISVLQHQQMLTADPQAGVEAIVLPVPVLNSEWAQAGGDSSHSMQNLQSGSGKLLWRASIGEGVSDDRPVLPSPVVADGRVFTVDTDNIASAFDVRTGKRLWERELAGKHDHSNAIPGGLAYQDGRVFVATGFGKVIALDAKNGKPLWTRPVGTPIHTPPSVAGGRVFVITLENQLFALNTSDGLDAWPPYQALAETARLLGGADPAVEGNVVVAPFSSGDLTALRADTGRPLWGESLAPARRTDEVSALAHIRARPVIDGDRVYAISAGGILAAFDIRNGHRIWGKDIGGHQSPWLAGNQIYQVTNDNQLICVSTETGRIHWVRPLPGFVDEKKREKPLQWAGPVLTGDTLMLVGTDGKMLRVSAYDGQIIGKTSLAEHFSVAPVIADGITYLLDDDGHLYAYR